MRIMQQGQVKVWSSPCRINVVTWFDVCYTVCLAIKL